MQQDKQLIASLFAGIVAIGLMTLSASVRADDAQVMEKCFGVVKTGQNDCDTDNGQCAPSVIDASPNDWIYLPKGICDKIVGGMTTPSGAPMPGGLGASSTSSTTSTTSTTKKISQPGNSSPSMPSTQPGNSSSSTSTTTTTTTQPGNSSATGGFNDGMNTPNTPYVNDYQML